NLPLCGCTGAGDAVDERAHVVGELGDHVRDTDQVDVGIEHDELCARDVLGQVATLLDGDKQVALSVDDQRRYTDVGKDGPDIGLHCGAQIAHRCCRAGGQPLV